MDHVRAVAIFFVFTWHFIHVRNGHFAPPPIFPLSLLTEGHTGVAIFMTLSGYLYAKLLDGKKIDYRAFFWNRFLRLFPLLFIVILIHGGLAYFSGRDLIDFAKFIVAGFIKPSLPNGGWAITVEIHFYLMLPLLLFFFKRWKFSLAAILLAAVFMRIILFYRLGQVQFLSYFTIIGRIDQFLLGISAYYFGRNLPAKRYAGLGALILFAFFFRYFDSKGGFYMNPSFPSPSTIWIYLPTIEGIAYALAISCYDNAFEHSTGTISRFFAQIGAYSYSIYLMHFFVVSLLSGLVDKYIINLSNIYMAMFFSALCFLVMVPIGYVCTTCIESPFLKFRKNYVIDGTAT